MPPACFLNAPTETHGEKTHQRGMLSIPLAVPEKIIGLTPILDFFDR